MFLLDRFFFLDDLTGFEITYLLEVNIGKSKSYYMFFTEDYRDCIQVLFVCKLELVLFPTKRTLV